MVRKIKAKLVMQLRNQGLSGRAIASAQGMARSSVQAVSVAAEKLGLGWDEATDLPDTEVYSTLFPGGSVRESVFAQPDWPRVHKGLARVGVTLKLLHQEYIDATSMAQATMSYDRSMGFVASTRRSRGRRPVSAIKPAAVSRSTVPGPQ